MSTNRTLPTTPISAIPSGVDVRDLRPYINRLADTVNTLIIIIRAIERRYSLKPTAETLDNV